MNYFIKSNKTNILHLTMAIPTGGSSRVLLDLLNFFNTKDDMNNILVVLSDVVADQYLQELSNLDKKSCFILEKQNLVYRILKLLKIILKNKIQIVHCDGFESFKIAMILKLLMPTFKLVYTIHDTHLIVLYKKTTILAKNLFVDAHVAISKAVEEECNQVNLKNTIQIDNGIDLNKYTKRSDEFNQKNDLLKIINVARIQPHKKGQDILIKALSECNKRGINFNCSLVGSIEESDIEPCNKLKELIKEYELEDKIQFLGTRADVPQLFQHHDLFILPSRFEGFGLVVIEAMASGLPVIASNNDGPKVIITHNQNGLLFENENHLELADQICDLYHNRDKMKSIAYNGYELSKNYSLDSMCNKYYKLYKSFNE